MQHLPNDVYWYYMVEMGFYVSLLLSLCMDARRKDFLQMILHHLVTLGLVAFSWATNLVRIGALVLCLHDTVDGWMEVLNPLTLTVEVLNPLILTLMLNPLALSLTMGLLNPLTLTLVLCLHDTIDGWMEVINPLTLALTIGILDP